MEYSNIRAMNKKRERLQIAFECYVNRAEKYPDIHREPTQENTGLPQWAIDMAEAHLHAKQYGDRALYSSVWYWPVIGINSNDLDNLAEIDWQAATDNWNINVAEAIATFIQDEKIKVAVIDCMLNQWKYKGDAANPNNGNAPKFDVFCENFKKYICSKADYSLNALLSKDDTPKEKPTTAPTTDEIRLPQELDNDEFRAILIKAVDAGLCSLENGKYKWNDAIQLCAYFDERMSDYYSLSNTMSGKHYKTSWKSFVDVFGDIVKDLPAAKQEYQRYGNNKPTDSELVDELLKDLH